MLERELKVYVSSESLEESLCQHGGMFRERLVVVTLDKWTLLLLSL